MKCKNHPSEQGAGVCASCLRERLLAILAFQSQLSPVHSRRKPEPYQPPPPPPAFLFPRSVSPYASRCRSSYGFFSTPQVGPTTGDPAEGGGSRRFSLLSYLFRHRKSGERETDPGVSKAFRARSWLSALIRGGRRKQRKSPAEGERPAGRARASRRARDRGMSPATDESDCGSESGYTSASSGAWRMPTPSSMRRAAAAHHQGGRGISSFTFCLSPMVQPSPGFRRGQTPEVAFSGDLRGGLNPHHHHRHVSAGCASLAKNRSRKLADFGRTR